ncbi:uncharacterized protein LOC131671424 [Phymastichus coffea]|uniref:uncharacterized protein LOC131671424 n=1 Tax=Phymastichus coffea TaxID=108790 RepID=UPI00273B359B|nr:uncharacterized protein LOC131671424 [Phymastichus coffea]
MVLIAPCGEKSKQKKIATTTLTTLCRLVSCKKGGKISTARTISDDLKEAAQTRTVVRGPIIIDARTLNAHPTLLSHPPDHHHHHRYQESTVSSNNTNVTGWTQQHQQASWCSLCHRSKNEVVGVAGAPLPAQPPAVPTLSASGSIQQGPGATSTVVGCLLGVYPGSSCSTGPRAPKLAPSAPLIHGVHHHHHHQPPPPPPAQLSSVPVNSGCRACCCHHQQQHQQPATAVQLTSQRGGISLRVARVASTTSVRAAPYAHSQHQGLGTECRCREETGAVGGGGAHILGGPMLFVPFTVPSFPATHQQQTSHPAQAHQSHHQQLQPPPAGAQTQIVQQQPPPPPQLTQLNHLNHQGIVQPPTSNQPTIHSSSCSPQQQATTPNKLPGQSPDDGMINNLTLKLAIDTVMLTALTTMWSRFLYSTSMKLQ